VCISCINYHATKRSRELPDIRNVGGKYRGGLRRRSDARKPVSPAPVWRDQTSAETSLIRDSIHASLQRYSFSALAWARRRCRTFGINSFQNMRCVDQVEAHSGRYDRGNSVQHAQCSEILNSGGGMWFRRGGYKEEDADYCSGYKPPPKRPGTSSCCVLSCSPSFRVKHCIGLSKSCRRRHRARPC